jgi:hypothetical protein
LSLKLTTVWGIAHALQLQVEALFFFCAPHMLNEIKKGTQLGYLDRWRKKPTQRSA